MRLPDRPPFALRGRLLSPLAAGGTLDIFDGVVAVDARGRIEWVGSFGDWQARVPGREAIDGSRSADDRGTDEPIDLHPHVLLPGMVDLHAHLPQLPNAGLGAGLDVLTWLDRYIFPLERRFDATEDAERLAPAAFRTFAAAGTTTLLAYGAVYKASMDGAFRAAEEHGIRAILGKVMMDRGTYDETIDPTTILERSVRESEELIGRWHGADDGRLGYAVTPRFAISCSGEMLRESAALAARTGAWWQTHVSEDHGEIAEVARLFPGAIDYVDVYDRAGGLGARTILAHAIHLSDRELARLVETDSRVAHCPASNLFLASGIMPLARYLEAGLRVGLGSDVAGGPDPSIFSVMQVGAYAQAALRTVAGEARAVLAPLDWLRLGTLDGARALGIDDRIGSIEAGKEADLIALDPRMTAARRDFPYDGADVEAAEVMSRLIFRAHPDMVRAAWVRGRRLEGPAES
ncbi:MAG TPA: guanine deaminase [Candidatus Limnocylindria bacterium]|nr:guanine deaminase [Candidatus Limnocylindria bacterium]